MRRRPLSKDLKEMRGKPEGGLGDEARETAGANALRQECPVCESSQGAGGDWARRCLRPARGDGEAGSYSDRSYPDSWISGAPSSSLEPERLEPLCFLWVVA